MSPRAETDGGVLDRWIPAAVISPMAQGVNAVFGVIGGLLVLTSHAVPPLVALATAVGGQAVVAGLLFVSCARATSGPMRLTAIAAIGALRGIALVFAVRWLGTPWDAGQAAGAVVASVVTTCVWLVAAGAVVQAGRDYLAMFDERMQRAVAEGVDEASADASASWSSARHVAQEEHGRAWASLTASAARVDGSVHADVARELLDVAESLHQAASDKVRPLSHALWDRALLAHARPRASVVITRTFAYWPAPTMLTAGLVGAFIFVVILVGAAAGAGLVPALVAAGSSAVACAALLGVRSAAQRARWRWSPWASALLLLLIGPAAFALMLAAGPLVGLPRDPAPAMVAALAAQALAVAVVMLVGIRRFRAAVLTEMDRLLASGFWQTEIALAIESRHSAEAAAYLHHRVQSQLLSVALGLELASRTSDPAELAEAVERARRRLQVAPHAPPTSASDATSVRALTDDWAGICEVELLLPADDALSPQTWSRLDLLLRETVANAVRAGGARQVRIDVTVEQDQLRVEVSDDGAGGPPGPAGLGSAWLAAQSRGRWSVVESPGRRHLTAHLTI